MGLNRRGVTPFPDVTRDSEAREESLKSATQRRKAMLVVATFALFGPALIAWGSVVQLPLVGAGATLACGLTLALVIAIVNAKTESTLDRLDYAVFALALLLLGGWALTELYFYPAYGTDESAFVQYAAQLLVHGHNPYGRNLLHALTQFRVPIQFATYKLNGSVVSTLGYPALSFLLAVPAVLVTHGVQSIIGENVVFLSIEFAMLYYFLPRAYRALAVVTVLGLPFLFDYSIGGDIVTMAVPFLLIVAYHWNEIGEPGFLRRTDVGKAICLGLAASISQFAWFVFPFVVLAIWCLRSREHGRRRATILVVQFSSIAVATFLLINAPFIIWNAHQWLTGVLSPLDQHAIPFGQGIVDASVFFHIGGGDLQAYTFAAVLVMFTLFVAFVEFFPRLWKATFILPSIIFFFSSRSLSEYFIMMVAMWLVSVLAPGGCALDADSTLVVPQVTDVTKPLRSRHRTALRRWGPVSTLVSLTLVAIAIALTSPAPLTIAVTSVDTNGQFRSIWRIEAVVTNHSSHALSPHFATDASGYLTTFWNIVSGPTRLRAGQSATYTLVAPNVGSMPGVTQPFLVQAVTDAPATISSSDLFTPEHFDAYISPSYVNRVVKLGSEVRLTIHLLSPYGAAVHRAGVRVALSQVIYGQNALFPGEAVINHAAEGQSPVFDLTNKNGVAHFVVSDDSPQGGNPLYFQANVAPPSSFPYGYSEVVTVEWSRG